MTRLLNVLILAGAFFAPLSAIAQPAPRATPVAAGDIAPDFTLEDQDGRKLTLSAERGKRPVVLVFYRGHW